MEVGQDRYQGTIIRLSAAGLEDNEQAGAYLIPTPPATKTTFLMLDKLMCGGGGHVKLPPTLTLICL